MAKSERQKLLESGEARGILKPEHKAELAAMRKSQGASPQGFKPTAKDIDGAQKAVEAFEASNEAIRTYDHIGPTLERFNPGPGKGLIYDAFTDNGGGFFDKLGAAVGTVVRPILPQQDQDDYQVINAAVNRNVKNWHKIEKGVQTAQDDVIAAKTDFNASNSVSANRRIIAKNRKEAELARVRTLLHSKWVGKYGSIARASENGMTFPQAAAMAERDYLASKARRQAPPSTRKAPSGWSVIEE